MRTINKKTLERFVAQHEEAKTLNLQKLAGHLQDNVIAKNSTVRLDNEDYSYTHDQMRGDVEGVLWEASVRVADYFGLPVDALKVQAAIEKIAGDLIDEVRVIAGNDSGVGPYDSPVPGEAQERVMFELEVSDD